MDIERDIYYMKLLVIIIVAEWRIHLNHGLPVHVVILLVCLNRNIPWLFSMKNPYSKMHLICNLCLDAGEISAQELGMFVLIIQSHILLIGSQKIAETAELLTYCGKLRLACKVNQTVAEQIILNLDMPLTSLKCI